jgi:ATP adenylyltransferase
MLKPGTLRKAIRKRTRSALASGALRPIRTLSTFMPDGGVDFLVRMVSSLDLKAQAGRQGAKGARGRANPFLPHDEAMFVADISATHLCLLNKYNVIDHHLLIVTRRFEDQRMLLTLADFEAISYCMADFEALAFYNGGRVAGASQRHKHLQMIPLPLAGTGPRVPIEPLIERARPLKAIFELPGFPFLHALAKLGGSPPGNRRDLPRHLLQVYRRLLRATGMIDRFGGSASVRQSGPYNLLFTRRWMMLVPRSRECFRGISVNALGFAGALLVKDERQMRALRESGPLAALSYTAVKRPD